MVGMERIFHKATQKDSLKGRMRLAQTMLVVLMLIPAVVSISMMSMYSTQYHDVIAHMEKVQSVIPLINDQLLIGLSDIVVGRTRFEDGTQFETINTAGQLLDDLIDNNVASRVELEVARRTLGTLERNVKDLGERMRAGSAFEENDQLLEEIRNVAALFVDMLQESVNAELSASADASNQMQAVVRITMIVEICLLGVTLLFTVWTQQSLTRAIQRPINHMVQFAGRIAGGDLSERVPDPDVEELRDLAASLNTMAYKLQRLIDENKQEQENLKKSELRAMQAQITPHFLYNTLDAIVWLAEAKRTGEVVNITRALSDFFRTSLNNGKDWITIAQEVEHLEGYLTIQKIRYRDILQYSLDVEEAVWPNQILKLLIQPLVENAIYHGIKNRRGGGRVDICLRSGEGNRLHVEVRDNGAGMTEERLAEVRAALERSTPPEGESGYGLYSVDKRIKLYYNQLEGLSVSSTQGEGTLVGFCVGMRVSGND